MNLIGQLGGYDKAKEMYIAQLKAGLAPYGYEEALLEYRRANSIFEVGDKVVWKESLSIISSLMEIESLDGDTWGIRHATGLEIQVGHRL